jgi:hypothetical protein
MVEQATETRKPRQPRPPAIPYVPSVELIDYAAGAYSVQSQSDPSEYYLTTVGRNGEAPTCTCPAGQTSFQSCKYVQYCKHVSAARIADSAITALISEQQARDAAQAARAQITAKPAYTPAPAGLMECYV